MSDTVYPIVEQYGTGFKVRVGDKAHLPGVYTTYLMAEKAKKRYLGKMVEFQQEKKAKSKTRKG